MERLLSRDSPFLQSEQTTAPAAALASPQQQLQALPARLGTPVAWPQRRYSCAQEGSKQWPPSPQPLAPWISPGPSPHLSNPVSVMLLSQLTRHGLGCLVGFGWGGSIRRPAGASPEGREGLGAEARGGIRAKGREPGSVWAARALPAVHLGQDLLHRGARESLWFGRHRHWRHLERRWAFARRGQQGGGHLLAGDRTRVLSSCSRRGREPLSIGGLG